MFILLVWAMYLPFRGGQLYNGPIYCMCIAAYGTAWATKTLDWPFGLAVLGGVIIGTFAGFLTSFAFSHSTGLVTATTSICLIFILGDIIRNTSFIGGAMGIMYIPQIRYLPIFIWVFVLLFGLFIYRIDSSRAGRALEAIRTDQDLAKTLGINLQSSSLFTMTVASGIGSLAGATFVFQMGMVSADYFTFYLLLSVMSMLYVGGRYTMWGPILTAPILWGLPLWVPNSVRPYMDMVNGGLLIAVLMWRPEGIISREVIYHIRVWGKTWFRQKKSSLPAS